MYVSLDFGGSTIDYVEWSKGMPRKFRSFERYPSLIQAGLEDFLKSDKLSSVEKIFVTGGKSRRLKTSFYDLPVQRIEEIEAIGRGGYFLLQNDSSLREFAAASSFLVVSMGTGTCMVKVRQKNGRYLSSTHIGGTGVGGGTFMGLSKALLKETDPKVLRKMFQRGDKNKVDLSVQDIVGGGIGVVPGDATASNLAKLSREIRFSKNDTAAGITNLIGQTIGITSVFAAKAHKCSFVLFTGKLTTIHELTHIARYTAGMYGVSSFVPRRAEYVSALGAGFSTR